MALTIERAARSGKPTQYTFRVGLVACGPLGGFAYADRIVRAATGCQAIAKARDAHSGSTGRAWYGERVERCQQIGVPSS